MKSTLHNEFDLLFFQVGSEGRQETKLGKAIRLFGSPFSLARRIIRDRPEIIHINASINHKSFPRDSLSLFVARILHRKVLFQVHGGVPPGELFRSALLTRFVHRVFRSADTVVLLGKTQKEIYVKFCPDARIAVIPNAITLDPEAKLRDSAPHGPLKLVFLGRLIPEKGIYECLAAASLLKDHGRSFTLIIAGAGPEEDALKSRVDALGLRDEVVFLGPLFGDDKNRLWRDSDVFVFPSYTEGLPYALLESMAAGTVPITTPVGAQPEVVEEGVHGFFVPVRNCEAIYETIAKLDDDRELVLEVAQQAALRARENYTLDRLSSEFGDTYRSLARFNPS